ncbi:hypothetical protein GGI35DRAFT_486722 [Trichoderma velutinum]
MATNRRAKKSPKLNNIGHVARAIANLPALDSQTTPSQHEAVTSSSAIEFLHPSSMAYTPGQSGQSTGHQSQHWPNSPLNPNPNLTPGLNQSYYGSGPLPPAAQHHPPHLLSSAAPAHHYPTHIAPSYGAVPPSQYTLCAPQAPYGQQPQGNQQYPPHYSQQYTQQFTYAPHVDVASPQPTLQWQLQQRPRYAPVPEEQQYKIYVHAIPASPGYEEIQNANMQHIDTTTDIKSLQAAMEGVGCDNSAIIAVLADPKYQDPRALHQLKTNYNTQMGNILADEIKSETKGNFEVALVALLRGPLDNDVYTLERALSGEGTDEEALNDVLLCRSNADIRAIVKRYNSILGRDLIQLINSKVDNSLFHLYKPILFGTKAENAAPVIPTEIDYEVAEIYRLVGSHTGTDTPLIASIVAGANIAQLRAMSNAYKQKYGGVLQDVIKRKFHGSTEDALLRILTSATAESGKSDADGLWNVLRPSMRDDNIFIYRALRLYWSDSRKLQQVHAAYKKIYGMKLIDHLNESLSRDYRELMVALIGEKYASVYLRR